MECAVFQLLVRAIIRPLAPNCPSFGWRRRRPRAEVQKRQKRTAWDHAYPGQLFPREHGREMLELGFHIRGIGHSIRDLLAKEFAIPLAKPVNSHLQRPF